ncbi:MAG: PEP-CTERM sorting domain-containing protein [Acidobacteriaceae bacterium]|nr:PEP-CTERM sorting domain-containing protein [Acidobacteriaceae bacterium]MBV9306017.1 PEP-CTERM sorting domain-containing protein [Acidobacteriaceae bacterium]
MHFSKKLILAAVACLAPVVGYAAPVTSNPSLSVDGLNFNNFTCSLSRGGVLATPYNCGQINVNTITQPGMGISFTSGFTAGAGFDDAMISYNVSSAAGISSIGLDFNGTFLGLAISSVTETAYSGGKQVGFAQVSCSLLGCSRTDTIALNGAYNNLLVKKDIQVAAALGVAQASYIDQTFTTDAPEPGSTALLGSGLLAVAGLLRRRSILGMLKK